MKISTGLQLSQSRREDATGFAAAVERLYGADATVAQGIPAAVHKDWMIARSGLWDAAVLPKKIFTSGPEGAWI
jgi:hypothetical protein